MIGIQAIRSINPKVAIAVGASVVTVTGGIIFRKNISEFVKTTLTNVKKRFEKKSKETESTLET